MRGKVQYGTGVKKVQGITPAYAGKSYTLHEVSAPDGDHPRLCGEKPVRNASEKKESGSPPPMRGKVLCGIFCLV